MYRTATNAYFTRIRIAHGEVRHRRGEPISVGTLYGDSQLLRGQSKKELILSSIRYQGEMEHDVNKLADKLLDELLPSDPGWYTENNIKIIEKNEKSKVTKDSNEITEKK